jgi:hypothetical protein
MSYISCLFINNKQGSTGCNDIVNSNQCIENILNKECLWVENEETKIPKCQEVKNSCKDILSSATCEYSGAAKSENVTYECIWISEESEGQRCQEVKNSCEEITIGNSTCEKSGAAKSENVTYECIWISEESEKQKCQEIKTSCGNISTSATCEYSGAAKSENKIYDCFWLYNKSSGNDGNCEDKNDSSLTCSDAKRNDQCMNTNISNFGTNCLWIIKNETSGIGDTCKTKVY